MTPLFEALLQCEARTLIGVAGIPGAGKTTLTAQLCQQLNDHFQSQVAIVVPMDGFHLTRSQLDALPNAAEAHRRRGAEWTFDCAGLLLMLRDIKTSHQLKAVLAPSFDHAVKDPKADDIEILPSHKYILVEGLYLHCDLPVWRDIAALFDRTVWIECDIDTAMHRVALRHVQSGICRTLDEAVERVDGNDRPNAHFIQRSRCQALPAHVIEN